MQKSVFYMQISSGQARDSGHSSGIHIDQTEALEERCGHERALGVRQRSGGPHSIYVKRKWPVDIRQAKMYAILEFEGSLGTHLLISFAFHQIYIQISFPEVMKSFAQ